MRVGSRTQKPLGERGPGEPCATAAPGRCQTEPGRASPPPRYLSCCPALPAQRPEAQPRSVMPLTVSLLVRALSIRRSPPGCPAEPDAHCGCTTWPAGPRARDPSLFNPWCLPGCRSSQQGPWTGLLRVPLSSRGPSGAARVGGQSPEAKGSHAARQGPAQAVRPQPLLGAGWSLWVGPLLQQPSSESVGAGGKSVPHCWLQNAKSATTPASSCPPGISTSTGPT